MRVPCLLTRGLNLFESLALGNDIEKESMEVPLPTRLPLSPIPQNILPENSTWSLKTLRGKSAQGSNSKVKKGRPGKPNPRRKRKPNKKQKLSKNLGVWRKWQEEKLLKVQIAETELSPLIVIESDFELGFRNNRIQREKLLVLRTKMDEAL